MSGADKTRKQIEIIERKNRAVKLRLDGYTYREIYSIMLGLAQKNAVIIPDSYDERYAYRDVRDVINEAKENLVESGEILRILELRNLDRMQNAVMDKAIGGSLKAIDSVLKIMRQREKYVPDLTQPKQVNVKTWQSEIIDLIKQGKITIEDVRNVAPEIASKLMDEFAESGSAGELPEGSVTIEGEFVDLGEDSTEVSGESG